MDNRDANLRIGLGSPIDVLTAINNLPRSEQAIKVAARDFEEQLNLMFHEPDTMVSAMALFCAYMNTSFRKTGMIYYVDGSLGISKSFYNAGNQRDSIAEAYGLD